MVLRHVLWATALLVLFCSASASLYEVFVPCCHEGVKWSSISYRCDNYPAPVVNISTGDQAACLAIIEVCCIKQTQMTTCEQGKQMAIDGEVCAIRDADPGAEQFRECCQCCRLGLESRQSRPACQSPGLGEPCDTKYQECCLGEATGQTNFTGTGLNTPTTTATPEAGSEESGSSSTTLMTSPSPTINAGSGEESSTQPTTPTQVKSTGLCRDGHSCQHRCVDGLGGYQRCQCYSGFRLQDDGQSCLDINECEEGTARCAPSQQCVNTIGRFTCLNTRCLPGSVYDAQTRRCISSGQQCQPGFAFNTVSGRCEDLNECGLGTDSCKVGERCENTIGSYTCRRIHHCGTGYTLDDLSQRCVDNDECVLGTHDCRGGYRCQNIQGSYRCVPKPCNATSKFDHIRGECVPVDCPKGFKSNGARRCVDINECTEKGRSACRRFQRCVNTRGSFYCRNIVNCPPGYEATEKDRCEDIDECIRGTHKCGPEQQCINRQGTYFCQCPRGLRHDNLGRCIDVDECSYGASICPSNTKCTNTLGSYRCECVDGLQNGNGDGDSCQDVDECAQQGICQQSCVNVLGTFFCTCDAGYQLRDDKRSCEDIDECTQFGGRGGSVCAGNCINVPGSYRCDCPEGLKLNEDGKSCEDINECADGTAFCPNQDSICINTKGGYKCPVVRCPEGFLKTNSSIQQNRGFQTEGDDVMCRKGPCNVRDTDCRRNRTKTIAWHFLKLPSLEFIRRPVTIFSVQTTGYSVYPNLLLWITEGNEEDYFQTSVMGDKASLKLIRPLKGPIEKKLTMVLENWDVSATYIISRHVTYVHVIVE